MKMIATLSIVVDGQLIAHGAEVETDNLPAGCVDSMLRLGQLVDPDSVAAEIAVVEAEVEGEPELIDPLDTPVASLQVAQNIREALSSVGLATVRSVLEYGREHETLTKISGIGKSSEKAIQEAITELLK